MAAATAAGEATGATAAGEATEATEASEATVEAKAAAEQGLPQLLNWSRRPRHHLLLWWANRVRVV